MKKRSGRFGFLFLGLLIGILAGILLAYWLNNNSLNFSFVSGLFTTEKPIKNSLSFTETEKINLARKKQPSKFLHHKIDSLSSDSTEIDLDQFLALYGDEYPDSVLINAYKSNTENRAKEVKVIMDELLYIKQNEVVGMKDDNNDTKLDSLLLDDRGYKRNKRIVLVEFWKSPINFQGYKWDTRKLVLYGFYESNYLFIKYYNEEYYMQYGTLYYHLEPSNNFLSMSPLDDNELIKKLNSL